MHPLDPAQGSLGLVAVVPRLSDRIDPHLAVTVPVVVKGERCRLAACRKRDRQAEGSEIAEVRTSLGLATLGDDDRLLPERAERPRCVPWAAPDPRVAAMDDITRQRADDGER